MGNYAQQKLNQAVRVLATSREPIREKLDIISQTIIPLMDSDFTDEFKEKWLFIKKNMKYRAFNKLNEDECYELAKEITDLCFLVAI